MKGRSLIDKMNQTFIALTTTAMHHSLSAWTPGEFRVPPEFGSGGGAHRMCDTRNIFHTVNDPLTDAFCCLNADFLSSSPVVEAKMLNTGRSIIRQMIHSTGTDPVMAQPHNYQGSWDENFLDDALEELFEQPGTSFNGLNSFFAATAACMWFSAVLPIGGSAIASSSEPVPCSNSNCNSNNITSITNMTSLDNMGLVNGTMIVEGTMSFGDWKWCLWSDLGFQLNAILF